MLLLNDTSARLNESLSLMLGSYSALMLQKRVQSRNTVEEGSSGASQPAAQRLCNVHRPPFDPAELLQLAEALQRFQYYLEEGVGASHIAPFRVEWVENALALLPPAASLTLPEEAYQELLKDAVDEMKDDYMHSMRRAIMQYIIKNPIERRSSPQHVK
jgi:dynein heavy chain, axonemal